MSKFKHALAERDAHIISLRIGLGVLLLIAAALWYGWQSAPRLLTVHNPPDLRAGSTRPWWEIPPGTVYAFTFYIFQQLNRWPTNGEEDYANNLQSLKPYLTSSCHALFEKDYLQRKEAGELRDRARGIYEIPGRGFNHKRVAVYDKDNWQVTLDLAVDEHYRSEPIKRALVRYPIKVIRYDIDSEKNPWGLMLDCYNGNPQRLEAMSAGGDK